MHYTSFYQKENTYFGDNAATYCKLYSMMFKLTLINISIRKKVLILSMTTFY